MTLLARLFFFDVVDVLLDRRPDQLLVGQRRAGRLQDLHQRHRDRVPALIAVRLVLVLHDDKAVGDDFSLFEVTTAEHFEITPLGDSDKLVYGDTVIDVSGALGMGKQFFEGYVSETHLDRPPLNAGTVQWTDIMLIQIGGGPGSSGSAIVSVPQNAIVGFLVGSDGEGDIGKICVPVAKFAAFVKAVDAGTYKKTKKSDDNAEPGDVDQGR